MNLLPIEFIVLAPLTGALAIGIGGRFGTSRRVVTSVAVGAVVFSFAVALMNFMHLAELKETLAPEEQVIVSDLWTWFRVTVGGSEVEVPIRFVFDSLSGLMCLVVTGIGALIHLYSVGYMDEEPSYARFFAYLNLFTASMLVLILGSSFPVMFVGWEGVGLCSYLLIGFWFENPAYAAAGRKAFIANRIGDFGVLIGMFILLSAVQSFEFADINAAAGGLSREFFLGGERGISLGGATIATVACLFLFLGCTGKSAQLPLYVWLPDAMAGPTPVSALIHAATMVTAGVYLCCRLSPVFLESPTALAVIAVVGALTAFLAATIAVVQKEMKKILAYSTVSQLGFMFAAVGVGAFAAGFFHVFTHAFFKACLFLGAGSVMHAVHAHGDANIFRLGGLRKIMPITHATFLLSCLAIAGVPPFSGFFSKDEILLGATTIAMNETALSPVIGWFVYVVLVLAATMTAFYMMRLYFLTFTGSYRSAESTHEGDAHDDHDHDHGYAPKPHESPWTMALPLFVLGVGAVVVGFLGLPHHWLPNWWGHWMEASVAHLPGFGPEDHADDIGYVFVAMGGGIAAMVVGVGAAFAAYNNKASDPVAEGMPKGLHSFLFDKWRVDELYGFLILRPIRRLAVLSGWLDKTFVDGLLTKMTSALVALASFLFTRLQVGVVHAYGLAIVIGLGVMGWWFVFPHPSFEAEVQGARVTASAEAGLGYEYRWDLDSDGAYDYPLQPSVVRLDLVDDLDSSQTLRFARLVHLAMQPAEWPQDRRALGRLVDRTSRVYELRPPRDELDELVTLLERQVESGNANPDGAFLESFSVEPIRSEARYDTALLVADHEFAQEDYSGVELVLRDPRGEKTVRVPAFVSDDSHDTPAAPEAPESADDEETISEAESAAYVIIDPDLLGLNWRRTVEPAEGEPPPEEPIFAAAIPPSVIYKDGVLHVRPNGAVVSHGGQPQTEPFEMRPGEELQIGIFPVQVVPLVTVTLEVRNAFGNVGREVVELPLRNPSGAALAEVVR